MRFGVLVSALVLAVAGLPAGGSAQRSSSGRLTVFAAASLTNVFPKIDSRPRYGFAGSDTLALQIKLAELIIAMKGAENRLATIEDMDEAELEQLHQDYRLRAEETLAHLQHRRGRERGS